MRSALILLYIYSSIIMSSCLKTKEYFSRFGRLNFSVISSESVIYQSKLSTRISLVYCAAECVEETLCLSYDFCSFPNKQNICILRQRILQYGTDDADSECQRYIMDIPITCQNGGVYVRSTSGCSCPQNVFGSFCEYVNTDCEDIQNSGVTATGVYQLTIGGTSFNARCDMDTDGGGWTVIQRRTSGTVDFYKTWAEYEDGFGSLTGEFWLGNKYTHSLTTSATYKIRIDMENGGGLTRYAVYNLFRISDASDKYKLDLGNYTAGDAGDSFDWHNGRYFTTKDNDNDDQHNASYGDANCAIAFHGAWWYANCHNSNLNGNYGNTNFGKGINWNTFTGYYASLTKTEMKVKRV